MAPKNRSSSDGGDIEGRYANYFKIGYNAYEFVIDFCQSYPENKNLQHHTRIISGPVYAKALLNILKDSINKYELEHGFIEIDNNC